MFAFALSVDLYVMTEGGGGLGGCEERRGAVGWGSHLCRSCLTGFSQPLKPLASDQRQIVNIGLYFQSLKAPGDFVALISEMKSTVDAGIDFPTH